MCREFHRVMGQEGPSHTTLFRYAVGKVRRRNVLTERYVVEAIHKITLELVQEELSESETQREHVEKELHQAEVRFRQLVENARDIIYRYRISPPGFEYVSPVSEEQLGYAPRELYADPKMLLKLVHPDDRQKLERGLQGKDPFLERETLRWVHRDGGVRWIERVNVPIHDEAGNLVAIEGIARDVTEHKEFEKALLSVIQGTSWTVAKDFPRSLVQQLAAALQVRFGFLAQLHPTVKNRACLLAMWDGTGYGKNFEYDIVHTPCEHVFSNGLSYYSANVQKTFPTDTWLKDKGIDSYLAIPVRTPASEPIGHLGVMHDGPMPQGPPRESILRVFATCASPELENRKKAKVS